MLWVARSLALSLGDRGHRLPHPSPAAAAALAAMDSLAKSGWHVITGDAAAEAGFPSEGAVTAKEVLADALNRDIKDYGDAFVQELVASAGGADGLIDTGDNGHVLQVSEVADM